MTQSKEFSEEQKKRLNVILTACGVVFFALGASGFMFESALSDLLNFEAGEAQVFSGALMFVGLIDIIIAKFMFKGQDRR